MAETGMFARASLPRWYWKTMHRRGERWTRPFFCEKHPIGSMKRSLLGSRGTSDSPLEMVEVVFGMRCDSTVMHTVARALSGRDKEVKLYEMHEVRGTFELT